VILFAGKKKLFSKSMHHFSVTDRRCECTPGNTYGCEVWWSIDQK